MQEPTLPKGGRIVRDIYEVLRKKQAQQARIGEQQIEALQPPRNSSALCLIFLDEAQDEMFWMKSTTRWMGRAATAEASIFADSCVFDDEL